jgi:hypothetical protein
LTGERSVTWHNDLRFYVDGIVVDIRAHHECQTVAELHRNASWSLNTFDI